MTYRNASRGLAHDHEYCARYVPSYPPRHGRRRLTQSSMQATPSMTATWPLSTYRISFALSVQV